MRNWALNIPSMSWDLFQELWAKQEGLCAICKQALEWDGRTTHVDHSHLTGSVRAILCAPCNLMIGYADDDPDRLTAAASYLREKMSS